MTSKFGPRRRATKAVQSSPSLNIPSAIAWPAGQIASIARRTIASLGGGIPRRRRGQWSIAPSAIISRAIATSSRACSIESCPRLARAPKRSMISSSAPACADSAQLAPCVCASSLRGIGHGARGSSEPPVHRVEQLAHAAPVVDRDDPPACSRGLPLGGRSRLPQMQEAHPVVGRPAFETGVGGEHGDSFAIDESRATPPTRPTRSFAPSSGRSIRPTLAPTWPRPAPTDANPAGNPTIFAHLDEAADVFARQAPALFGAPGRARLHGRERPSLERGADARARAIVGRRRGPRGRRENQLFNVIVHGAAYVGACVVRAHGGRLERSSPALGERRPAQSHAPARRELAVFHWWLKSLADDGFDRGVTLADRYRAHVENPTATPESLPVIAPADRRLPRLVKPRYDTLYKWLRAHLPELRDVGRALPVTRAFRRARLRVARLRAGRRRAYARHVGRERARASPVLAHRERLREERFLSLRFLPGAEGAVRSAATSSEPSCRSRVSSSCTRCFGGDRKTTARKGGRRSVLRAPRGVPVPPGSSPFRIKGWGYIGDITFYTEFVPGGDRGGRAAREGPDRSRLSLAEVHPGRLVRPRSRSST